MLARATDGHDDAGVPTGVHELPSYIGGDADQLALAELVLLVLADDRERPVEDEIDLFLLAVAMDPPALARLKRDLVQAEAGHAEGAPQGEEALLALPVDVRDADTRLDTSRIVAGGLA
jgi:hypothetical protein